MKTTSFQDTADNKSRMTTTEAKKARLMGAHKDITTTMGCQAVPKPIVAVEFTEDMPLHDAFIGVLKNKRDSAVAIKKITTILPGLTHLKRCSDGRLLLAFFSMPTSSLTSITEPSFPSTDSLKAFLQERNFDLNLLEDDFLIIPIPLRSPKTKSQASKLTRIWPVNFHPDPLVESIMNGSFFNANQLRIIESCMRLCVEAARQESTYNEDCIGSAVILDPNNEGVAQVLAIAACRTNEHPMWHAAMLAVDLVAQIRGGGAWDLKSYAEPSEGLKRKSEDISLPACYPSSLATFHIPQFPAAEQQSKLKNDTMETTCAYLCTNYWIFLLEEPCPLCAMALVHSRVSMVFYGRKNNSRGVLASKAMMHTLPGLNHRYKVWADVLEDECEKVVATIAQRGQVHSI